METGEEEVAALQQSVLQMAMETDQLLVELGGRDRAIDSLDTQLDGLLVELQSGRIRIEDAMGPLQAIRAWIEAHQVRTRTETLQAQSRGRDS